MHEWQSLSTVGFTTLKWAHLLTYVLYARGVTSPTGQPNRSSVEQTNKTVLPATRSQTTADKGTLGHSVGYL
jgi:hypothetical protein